MYHSSKTVKRQTAKMTIGVPIVTCQHRVRRIHKAAQTPLPCETSITCAWAVATSRRPWAGLTVCVYIWILWTSMRLASLRCRVLLHSLLPTDDACSSSSLSTTVIKFSIFSDPVRIRRLKLFGHVARADKSQDHSRALQACISLAPRNWRRRPGRPRHTWLRTVEEDLR